LPDHLEKGALIYRHRSNSVNTTGNETLPLYDYIVFEVSLQFTLNGRNKQRTNERKERMNERKK